MKNIIVTIVLCLLFLGTCWHLLSLLNKPDSFVISNCEFIGIPSDKPIRLMDDEVGISIVNCKFVEVVCDMKRIEIK